MSDKIVNIGHADNVHIEGVGTPELSKMSEKIDTAIDRIPDLIESTIMLFFSKAASGQLNDNTVIFQDYTSSRPMPVSPVSLKSKREETYSVGDVVMSHWQIDGCIGKGSFSTVYAAHHTGRGMQFSSAIKVIHSALLPFSIVKDDDISYRTINATYMVQQELDNMVELKGTGYIVDYEDHEMVNYSDGSRDTLIRMELLEPLSDVLHSKTLSQDDVIRVGIDICKALELCYSNNIIHRDVKPSNIYLTKWGGYKLGDFSASTKVGDPHETDQIGTLKYMAPEVCRGKSYSANIDIYSLGLVLYELLNGEWMQSHVAKEATLSQRLSGASLPPIPRIDNALQSVIKKACSYNPEDRFATPTEMLSELLKLHAMNS